MSFELVELAEGFAAITILSSGCSSFGFFRAVLSGSFSSAGEVAVAVVWAGVHLVRGGHVILGFGGLVEDFVAEAALDLRRFASVL